MLHPAVEFAFTFATHRVRRKSHTSYLADRETVIHRYDAVSQTTGTFATVNRSDTQLPDPTTGTAGKRHARHQSATVNRVINKLQDLATGRAVEQRSTPSARNSQINTHQIHTNPPSLFSLLPTNRNRAVSTSHTSCPSLSPPSCVGMEGGNLYTAHYILPPSTAFEISLQGVCALAPVAGRLTSVTYHGQAVPKYEPHREVSAQNGEIFRNRISYEVSYLHVTHSTVRARFDENTKVRACLSTLFFDRKCAVETKYSDLIGRDFNYRSLFRRWLRSRPIRSGFLFSTSLFRSKKNVLRHALRRRKKTIHWYVFCGIAKYSRQNTKKSGRCSMAYALREYACTDC